MLSPGLHRRVKPIRFKGYRVTYSPVHTVCSIRYSQRATQICILHQTYWFGNRAMHLYLGDVLCEYRPAHQIGSLIFVFLVLLQTNAGVVPRLDHECFFPNSFQFITHPTICRYII